MKKLFYLILCVLATIMAIIVMLAIPCHVEWWDHMHFPDVTCIWTVISFFSIGALALNCLILHGRCERYRNLITAQNSMHKIKHDRGNEGLQRRKITASILLIGLLSVSSCSFIPEIYNYANYQYHCKAKEILVTGQLPAEENPCLFMMENRYGRILIEDKCGNYEVGNPYILHFRIVNQ